MNLENNSVSNTPIKEEIPTFPYPSEEELSRYPVLKGVLAEKRAYGWDDSDWDDKETWGESWNEHVDDW
jgi:hypothetical protein